MFVCARAGGSAATPQENLYRPKLAVPETLQPFLKHLDAGNDQFPAERQATELEARLREFGEALRAGPDRAARVVEQLLHQDFRGGRIGAETATAAGDGPLELTRPGSPSEPTLDARAFASALRLLIADLREVTVTEFLITSVDSIGAGTSPLLRTDVRYDIVGTGVKSWRVEHVGVWKMSWRQDNVGLESR